MSSNPLDIYKAQFDTKWVAYMDTAAEGLPLQSSSVALAEYFADKTTGTPGREKMSMAEREAIRLAAGLLKVSEKDVAFAGSATEALNTLGSSIRWKAGDEVLTTDLEFSSNVVCWLRLRDQGVRVVVIPSHNGVVEFDQFVSYLNPSTRIVTVSQVSYKTGTQFPYLKELSEAAHKVGALFVVDATQALGRVPVSIEGVDFLVSSSYKWLLATHGLGLVYCSPELRVQLTPGAAGWYSIENVFAPDRFEAFTLQDSAMRFVGGMPNMPSLYVMRDSLRMLTAEFVEEIDRSLTPLVRKLSQGFESLGLSLLTPSNEAYASGIVSFAHQAPEQIGRQLRDRGIIVWAGDGRVRTSIHLYNDEQNVNALLEALDEIMPFRAVA